MSRYDDIVACIRQTDAVDNGDLNFLLDSVDGRINELVCEVEALNGIIEDSHTELRQAGIDPCDKAGENVQICSPRIGIRKLIAANQQAIEKAVRKERRACIKVCANLHKQIMLADSQPKHILYAIAQGCDEVAQAIRAREE